MPVGSDHAYVKKRDILDEVLARRERLGHFPLEKRRGGGFELEEALADMRDARVIIADLGLERPSCYFEVGLAQGAGLHVRIIAPTGTDIHQVGGRDSVEY